MPVCITGMHRSGTSLVANVLGRCGLYLGDGGDLLPASDDNQAGYWENKKFVDINDGVLEQFDGRWDIPPVYYDGWTERQKLNALRGRAELLVQQFRKHEPWGWKDPRTSLTLPFWRTLAGLTLPFLYGQDAQLKVVLCVRNPFEVFYSLRDRRHGPSPEGLNLWLVYNQAILDSTLPDERIVTHYESFFDDPKSEILRLSKFLNLDAPEDVIDSSIAAISDKLRRQKFRQEMVAGPHDAEVDRLYEALCVEANRKI